MDLNKWTYALLLFSRFSLSENTKNRQPKRSMAVSLSGQRKTTGNRVELSQERGGDGRLQVQLLGAGLGAEHHDPGGRLGQGRD